MWRAKAAAAGPLGKAARTSGQVQRGVQRALAQRIRHPARDQGHGTRGCRCCGRAGAALGAAGPHTPGPLTPGKQIMSSVKELTHSPPFCAPRVLPAQLGAMDVLREWCLRLQGVLPTSPAECAGSTWLQGSEELRALCVLAQDVSQHCRAPPPLGDAVRDAFLGGVRGELGLYLGALARLEAEVGAEYSGMLAAVEVAAGRLAGSGGGGGGGALRAAALGLPLQHLQHLRGEESGGGGAGAAAAAVAWLLRRLHAWAVERTVPLRALVALVRSVAQQSGAALCSTAYAHCGTGDPRVRPGMVRVFAAAAAPLHAALRCWVLHGAPLPGAGAGAVELCVEEPSAAAVGEAGPWLSGHRLCKRRLPAYVPLPLAEGAVRVGKAVRFLREANGDGEWVQRHIVPLGEVGGGSGGSGGGGGAVAASAAAAAAAAASAVEDAALAATELPALASLVHAATALVNYRLVQQVLGRHRALAHLQVMHRYVLLTQGDFVTVLLAGMGAELDKPAAGLAMKLHTLGGILEGAVRGSNAALEDRALTDCLYVQLAAAGAGAGSGASSSSSSSVTGALGWDVFRLAYRVEAPLTSILHNTALATYRALFTQLWFVRRCEAALSSLWNASKTASSAIDWLEHRPLGRLLHNTALARMRMGHFLAGLRGYIMLGVLAPAWAALEDAVGAASDFDGVLAAHEAYLRHLRQRLLFMEAGGDMGTAGAGAGAGAGEGAAAHSARQALDAVLRAILCFTQEGLGILAETEPLAADARGMGIRARAAGAGDARRPRQAPRTHREEAAEEEEVRVALCAQLDTIVRRRGSSVKVLTVAFSSQMEVLMKELSTLEAKCVARCVCVCVCVCVAARACTCRVITRPPSHHLSLPPPSCCRAGTRSLGSS
jgi:hypothetical protein